MRVSPGEGGGGRGGCGGLMGALEKRPIMGVVAEEEEEKGVTTTLETRWPPWKCEEGAHDIVVVLGQ
uniref:Uncharacterized protein n=1 Tax=Oryza nivara TaxID=4536 RepID=A0A0E0G8K1_ORYNI